MVQKWSKVKNNISSYSFLFTESAGETQMCKTQTRSTSLSTDWAENCSYLMDLSVTQYTENIITLFVASV